MSLKVEKIKKLQFKKKEILHGINFEVKQGEDFSVLQVRTEAVSRHCFVRWRIFFRRTKAVSICMDILCHYWPSVLDLRTR